jgi:hypothetical protein
VWGEGITKGGCGTLRDQPERIGDLDAALEGDRRCGGETQLRRSVSPLEERAAFLLGRLTEQPALTLDEIVAVMAGQKSQNWACLTRHDWYFSTGSAPTPRWWDHQAAVGEAV